MLKLIFILGCHDDHVGHVAQIGIVECAMMGRAVFRHEPAAVNAERHWKILGGNVVDDLIVGALQECRIHRHNRPHALRGQAGCKGHGMLLGDADIVEAVREFFQGIPAGSLAHRCGNGHDPTILRANRMSESMAI